MKTNRREFTWMGAGTVLGAMGTQGSFASLLGQTPEHATTEPWYRRIRRVGQTNFNEKDPLHADVNAWADYWASAKVDAVALSVSGLVAFYPTDVPFFPRSRFLQSRDLFGECVKAAKARGMRVFGRMSPDIHQVEPEVLRTHPLWFRRQADGTLQSSAPGVAFTCQFGGSFRELQPAILRELNAHYDIDGVYMNGWPTAQVCFCDSCRKIGDPHSQQYKDALMADAAELIDLYKKIVTEKNPDNFYSCNLGGGLKESGIDQWKLTRDAPWYTADNQSREGVVAPVWQDAQQVKFAQCLMGGRSVAAVTGSYSRSGRIMWRNVTGEPAEIESRMAQTAAAGGIVWYHWLGLEQGFAHDRRWQKTGRDFLSWHARHDRHFHNVQSLAKVALVASPRSVSLYNAPTEEDRTDFIEGMYAVLTEARIPFDFLHEQSLSAEHLSRYSAVLLPNVALLSDAQCAALRQYANHGGSLLATFETSLYDENGKPRADFALGELFGIRKAGERERASTTDVQPIWSVNLQSILQRNAITEGFEETDWIAGPVWRVPLQPVAEPVMTFIDPYPTYPPEAVYMRDPPTQLPSIVLREHGASRRAYLAGDMDASYWRIDNWDLARQLLNTIHWVLGENNAVSVEGEGLLDIHAWETEPGFAVHMVNYNGPHAYRGNMRKLTPLGPQTVRMQLPREVTIRKANLLRAETPLEFQQWGRMVEFTVPSVGAYEVAALET